MVDAADLIRPLYWLARSLVWVGWDLLVQTVGWSVGWLLLRVLTLGRVPRYRLSELDKVSWWYGLFVEMVGLAALAAVVWYLSGFLPAAAIS